MGRRGPRLEKGIEGSGDRYAKDIGWLSRKLNGTGYRSWPDRMYVGPRRLFFIEYKRPGNTATPDQLLMHELLRAAGFGVYLLDTVAEARRVIDLETKAAGGRRALAKFRTACVAVRARFVKELGDLYA